MSRIGSQPIPLPETVNLQKDGDTIVVKGPKGELKLKVQPGIQIAISKEQVKLGRKNNSKRVKSLHGLTRSLIANMVLGVTEGFSKVLEMHGTGYRASLEGKNLKLMVGFSHPVIIEAPEGIKFTLEENKIITISGIDKQLVGQIAAQIREVRKPEPYKGKGIRYQGEVVKRKAGKAAKTEGGAA